MAPRLLQQVLGARSGAAAIDWLRSETRWRRGVDWALRALATSAREESFLDMLDAGASSQHDIKGRNERGLFDQDMDDFLMSKVLEEGFEESRLFKKEFSKPKGSVLTAKDVKDALIICEDQLQNVPEKVEEMGGNKAEAWSEKGQKDEGVEFSSLFGTFRSDVAPGDAVSDEAEDLQSAVANERLRNGLSRGFLESIDSAKRQLSAVEDYFGPIQKPQLYKRALLEERDLLSQLPPNAEEEMTRVPEGGFRVNVYRNITGSVKELLISLRREIMENVMSGVEGNAVGESHEFLRRMKSTLKLKKSSTRRNPRPHMNDLCLFLMKKLSTLQPNELALVALVFGEVGYTNSLVLYQLFSELQKPETLCNMSTKALCGAVLSLGMLQSMDLHFMDAVHDEFLKRVHDRQTTPLPPDVFASLLLGCCHLKEGRHAKRLSSDVLDTLSSTDLIQDDSTISWTDLAIAMYVAGEMDLWKPALLEGVHSKLTGTSDSWDINSIEASVLLMALEASSPEVIHGLMHSVWKETYAMLEDRIGELLQTNDVAVTAVPDLVRSLSFPGLERVDYLEPLGKLVVEADPAAVSLPIWTLVFRLMAGYANVRYRDPAVLKAINERLLESRLPQLSASSITQMLLVGSRLRGLDERLVDKIVEIMGNSYFWKGLYRSKDAAKIAFSLAGFEKLTPEIFGECWKRCQSVPFSRYPGTTPQEAIDILFMAQGLFAGYQYIRHKYSPSVARKYVSLEGHRNLYGIIKLKNATEAGQETQQQREAADVLKGMGIAVTAPGLIEDGLYHADVILHDTKAVLYMSSPRSFFCNATEEPVGFALLAKRAIEALKIKVVLINTDDWERTPLEEREQLLIERFAAEGVHLAKIAQKREEDKIRTTVSDPEAAQSGIAEWLDVRLMVLKEMKKDKLKEMLMERSAWQKDAQTNVYSHLTRSAMIRNEVISAEYDLTERPLSSMRKAEFIKAIVDIEIQLLFGQVLHALQQPKQMTAIAMLKQMPQLQSVNASSG